MARVKISEYRAKRILLGDEHKGIQIRSGEKVRIPKGRWVAKVDQGVKKRFKQGLLVADIPAADILKAIRSWEKKGFSQFILEPLVEYEANEEQYFSLERVREGVRMLHAQGGGVDIETRPEAVQTYLIRSDDDIAAVARRSKLPQDFLQKTYSAFNKNFFAFLEINPLVVHESTVYVLDAAVLVDSAGEFFVHLPGQGDSWSEDDIIMSRSKHPAETRVEELARTTPASLKLSVLNPDGSLFFLLSGGGGSIVIADEAQLDGAGGLIGNYGEYSGGPSREETYLYAKEVIGLMLASCAKKRALIIAGGVANFTDVRTTFLGIIDALTEVAPALRKAGARVFVRRGGPNETVGLELMREFLAREELLGTVHGSSDIITSAVSDAIQFLAV
jgi:ATP-citrate lyase beta-subunit